MMNLYLLFSAFLFTDSYLLQGRLFYNMKSIRKNVFATLNSGGLENVVTEDEMWNMGEVSWNDLLHNETFVAKKR